MSHYPSLRIDETFQEPSSHLYGHNEVKLDLLDFPSSYGYLSKLCLAARDPYSHGFTQADNFDHFVDIHAANYESFQWLTNGIFDAISPPW
jgi:hypothetical protein